MYDSQAESAGPLNFIGCTARKLATAEECEKVFGMPAKYFIAQARAGSCPSVRYDRKFSFSIPAVEGWLHKQASTPEQLPKAKRQKKAKPEQPSA